jgi:hopene-associated glycosyltransferase HpnB
MIMKLMALASLAAWGVILFGRGGFWQVKRDRPAPEPESWPEVVAVVPARDEAPTIGLTVHSLLSQDYPGKFAVVVVDDNSTDGTAEVARQAAEKKNALSRLTVVSGKPLPGGWAGKVWAMDQGLAEVVEHHPGAEFILFTDADIEHVPAELKEQVARAQAGGFDLTSLMVRLHCETLVERAVIPAFVYFFRLLYPFKWIAQPRLSLAGAAGGYMLVRRSALARIGGMSAIKGDLIDDCALAQALKDNGARLWLGLAEKTRSLRVYNGWREPWDMIARSAYVQLKHSPLLLAGTVAGLLLTFIVPPLWVLTGKSGWFWALLAWAAMAGSYLPMLRFYRRSVVWAPALPLVALFYLGATVHSAIRHHLGRGGQWKGRIQAGKGEGEGGEQG